MPRSNRARSTRFEWVGPYDDEKFGERKDAPKDAPKPVISKVAPNYYYPGWWKGGMQLHLVVAKDKFDALPKAYQAALRAAAAIANASILAKYDAANPGALKRLVVGGAQLRLFPQDAIEACYKTANDLYAQLAPTIRNSRRSPIPTWLSAPTSICGGRSPNIPSTIS